MADHSDRTMTGHLHTGGARLALVLGLALALAGALAGCGNGTPDSEPDIEFGMPDRAARNAPDTSVFGTDGGISLLGNDPDRGGDSDGGGIGVNSYLWRASLDTVAFMPLDGTPDPFGGVIITEWWSPADSPQERFKANVFILGRELRSDGVRVALFRQVRDDGGAWVDSAVEPGAERALEDAILTRARELRVMARGQG
jgi:hypothetical protein